MTIRYLAVSFPNLNECHCAVGFVPNKAILFYT